MSDVWRYEASVVAILLWRGKGSMSYGIFSDTLPLFVGEEQVLVFEKNA